MIYKNKYGKIAFWENNHLCKSKNVILRVSGGLDSTLILYLLARENEINNLNLNIYTLTTLTDKQPYEYMSINVPKIIYRISQEFSATNIIPFIFYRGNENKNTFMRDFINKIKPIYKIDTMIDGWMKGPPEDYQIKNDMINDPIYLSRKNPKPVLDFSKDPVLYNPFAEVTKKFTACLYKSLQIEDIIKMTWSCVDNNLSDRCNPSPCKKCWWCKEKYYGFGIY